MPACEGRGQAKPLKPGIDPPGLILMNYQLRRGLKIRMVTILALMGIGALAVIARAVQLQVIEAHRLKSLAARQHRDTIEIKSRRGDILDRRGETLAVSRKEAQVFARPGQVKDKPGTAKKLSSVTGLDPGNIEKKLRSGESFVWIKRSASIEEAEATEELSMQGIGLLPASRRFYPGGHLAANILGFTGVDGKGLEGLEYQYEEVISGRPVRMWIERDARGNYFTVSDHESGNPAAAPVNQGMFELEARGASLELTILRPLQYMVEKELEKGIERAGAKAGCVVAMDPGTGEVLAMASRPSFDPNSFNRYSQEQYRNRCVQSAYEPGSTFKVFMAASALEYGIIRPDDKFDCEQGRYTMGGETISDIKEHGLLTLGEVIVYSSNVGASKIGETMGKKRMYQAITEFGFGKKTGLAFPGESPGVLRHYHKWSQVAVGTISFGQGIAVTPLQMVTALSSIANNGVMMKPFIVKELVAPDGKSLKVNEPQKLRKVISSDTAGVITGFMQEVVSHRGTGKAAMLKGYSVAGKTGTAQKPKEKERGYAPGKYMASFMGFLPARDPGLAMIVVIDEPHPEQPWGGKTAAPVFRNIAEQAVIMLGIPSAVDSSTALRREGGHANAVAKTFTTRVKKWRRQRAWNADANKRDLDPGGALMPRLRGLTLRQALRALENRKVEVSVSGTGIVAGQSPQPGTSLQYGQAVDIYLEGSQ